MTDPVTRPRPVTGPRRVVVIGGGLAGARTAQELRGQGYRGQLTLLAAEPDPPYDRPPLSKELLRGQTEDSTLEVDWAGLDVELRLGCPALGLTETAVRTAAGPVPFDAAVLATGSTPRTLGEGRVLRTAAEARQLRAALRPGTRLVVVGASWIGAEVATAAAAAGCRVSVLELAPAPLAQTLGELVGARTAGWYAAAGVDLHCATAVAEVRPDRVTGRDRRQWPADVVLVGVGVYPATGWLAGSGVTEPGRAVPVDPAGRTNRPGVYAVGDCTVFRSGLFDTWLHIEHWDNALHAPEVVAANVLGRAEVYDPVPYFWSEQFGRTLQYVGHREGADRFVWRGPPDAEEWAGCWLRDGRLLAVVSVDRPREAMQARRLIAARAVMDEHRLTDPSQPLRECVAGRGTSR